MRLTKLAEDGNVVHVACEGDISQMQFRADGDPLERLLGPGCYTRQVLLNLEKTTFVDSSGISWLVVAHRHFARAGGRFVLHSIPPRVNQVLQLLRMGTILNLAADEAAARALLGGGPT